jgi:hypothetical protein
LNFPFDIPGSEWLIVISRWVNHWRQIWKAKKMKVLLLFVLWCILFVLCWPLALLALVLFPLVWLVALPFRLLGLTVGAVFALLEALFFLPARLLGWRRQRCRAW